MNRDPNRPEIPSDEELNARFEKIRAGLTEHQLEDYEDKLEKVLEPRVDRDELRRATDDLDEKMARIEERAQAARQTLESTKAKTDSISGSLDPKSTYETGMGLMYAYALMGGPVLGFLIGLGLNRLFGTQGLQIWLTIGGAAFGLWWVMHMTSARAEP